MLVITRNPDESIVIDGNIRVVNLGVNRHGQCKFGIDAPEEIKILRTEILGKKWKPNEKRSKSITLKN